ALKSVGGLNELARLVDRQHPPVVRERVNHHHGILPRLDDLVEIAARPHPRGHGERAIPPDRLPSPDNVPSRQAAGGEIVVAGDGHQRAAELPRSVLHEARLAATGGALQHHGETPPVTLLEDLDLVAEGQVKRLLLQDAKTFRYLAIDGTRCFSHSSPQ